MNRGRKRKTYERNTFSDDRFAELICNLHSIYFWKLLGIPVVPGALSVCTTEAFLATSNYPDKCQPVYDAIVTLLSSTRLPMSGIRALVPALPSDVRAHVRDVYMVLKRTIPSSRDLRWLIMTYVFDTDAITRSRATDAAQVVLRCCAYLERMWLPDEYHKRRASPREYPQQVLWGTQLIEQCLSLPLPPEGAGGGREEGAQ